MESANNQDVVAETPAKSKKHLGLWIIIFVLLLIFGFIFLLFGRRIVDYFAGRDYTPGPELINAISNLNLTEDADIILRAVHPVLQDADDFNSSCPSTDDEMSTLGCFSPSSNRIYIYRIKSEELNGIKESVLAHELLHAIYYRLNNIQRAGLNDELKKYYDDHRDLFGDYLSTYSSELFYTELHSVVGQRMKSAELPESLRNHYAKYFRNQDAIASYYAKYRGVFQELKDTIEQMSKEVETQREDINKRRELYQAGMEEYDRLVEEYNTRVSSGYYRTQAEAERVYDTLRAKYVEIEAGRERLNEDIEKFNQRVATLNEYVEYSNELSHSVNSNYRAVEKPTNKATLPRD